TALACQVGIARTPAFRCPADGKVVVTVAVHIAQCGERAAKREVLNYRVGLDRGAAEQSENSRVDVEHDLLAGRGTPISEIRATHVRQLAVVEREIGAVRQQEVVEAIAVDVTRDYAGDVRRLNAADRLTRQHSASRSAAVVERDAEEES